jgi:hypothetical protein
VVFVGVAGSGSPQDNYAFLLLAPVSAGTTIFITDQTLNGGAGGFYDGEGLFCWTTTTNLPAFTLVKIGTDNGDGVTPSVGTYVDSASSGIPTGISSDGDQLIAFEGSVTYPYFVGAINLKKAWQTSDSVDKNNSYLPPGLTDGSTAMAWTYSYEGYYDCSKGYSGTAAQLRALILNSNNWNSMANGNFPEGALCDFNATPTYTTTATVTSTGTSTATPTHTWDNNTPSPTPTDTGTPTVTPTVTDTLTLSPTTTITGTPTETPTITLTPTVTNTSTSALTPTITNTPVPTTALSAGDVAFVGYQNGGSPVDQFAFILLKDVVVGTQVEITDKNWTGSAFITSESIVTWTSDQNYSVGTVIQVGNDGSQTNYYNTVYVINGGTVVTHTGEPGFFVNTVGGLISITASDQLFAFQGDPTAPTFIAGINYARLWNGGSNGAQSMLPTALTDGSTALAFSSTTQMGIYDCANSGLVSADVATLRSAINNSANWTRASSTSDLTTSWCGLVVGDVVTLTPTPIP